MRREEIGIADEKVVRAMCDHLIKAYEEFCNKIWPKTPAPLDSLMGAHNFYIMVVLHLERDYVSKNPEARLFWRKVALDTLAGAIENRPEFPPPPPPSETQFTRRRPGRKKKKR